MSAYSFPQASFDDHNTNYDSVNIPFPQQTINPQARLSPFSSPHAHSNPASPPISNTHTPASSIASLSVQFSHSELQEQLDLLGFDPFLGASFSDDTTQSPNFLQKNDLGSSFNLNSSNYPRPSVINILKRSKTDESEASVKGKPSRHANAWRRYCTSPLTDPIIPFAEKDTRQVSDFSSGSKHFFVEGDVNGTPAEAFPDYGADLCFISQKLASNFGLCPAPMTKKKICLANKKLVQSPGMVEVPWRFAGEQKTHILSCWILPGCFHDLILGYRFLVATETLTTFFHRIKARAVRLSRRLRLMLLGRAKQRLLGSLDGYPTAALPDTGSDVMLVSSAYARKIGLTVDRNFENWLEVEFADGTTAWTSGVARNVRWNVGRKSIRCDFHVLDDLLVDVILSKDYLFDLNVFSEHKDCFFDADSEDDLFQLCNIRLIGRYGDTLNVLEEEYLQDVTSLDAFGPDMVERELARRDLIRDEILALPENQREAATQAEAERQRRWQKLRQAHRTRWGTESLVSQSLNGPGIAHRTEIYRNLTQVSGHLPTGEVAEDDLRGAAARRVWWKKRVRVHIPLQFLKRGREHG